MNTISKWSLALAVFAAACEGNGKKADAYGNFEADEVLVSAEMSGRLLNWQVEEGDWLPADTVVAVVDTTQLQLRKEQLLASIRALISQSQDVQVQTRVFDEQLANLQREKARLERLVRDSAATSRQLDDVSGQIEVLRRQMAAQTTSLSTVNRGLAAQTEPLRSQIAQVEDQIARSKVRNPVAGRVLSTYFTLGEVAVMGKPLYKIADTRELILRAYVSGEQLASVQTGQTVTVHTDQPGSALKSQPGELIWVASEAEFTPKVIQTREERVNLVYAVKIRVRNDGSLKIGMPAEVSFTAPQP
jgi:HlyD family secretion protein